MRLTEGQLRRIIREVSQATGPDTAPDSGDEAYQMGFNKGRSGRPDLVYKALEAWLGSGVQEEIADAYLHGYKMGQMELDIEYMDMWDDDDDDDAPHAADQIADKLGMERAPVRMRRRSSPRDGRQGRSNWVTKPPPMR